MISRDGGTRRHVLKVSSIMGASAGINLLMSMLRVKLVAIYVGVVGVGIMATYSALLTVLVTMVGMGIHVSAIRNIALANSANDQDQLALSITSLMRLSWVLGVSGMVVVAMLCNQLSFWAFDKAEYAWSVALLSSVILLNTFTSSFSCIIQGVRSVGNYARVSVWGSLAGTAATFMCLYTLGDVGIVWALITAATLQMFVAKFYSNKLRIKSIKQSWGKTVKIGSALIFEGAPQMVSILVGTSSALVILSLISHRLGMQSVGLYSAAFTLSGAFVGFILVSMSADYYPRLIEAGKSKVFVSDMVNEQTEIGLLLIVPGLLACVLFAPFLLQILYTNEFLQAGEMLQWFMLGCLGRVISSPMAFVLLALGKSKVYLLAEIFLHAFHVSLVFFALEADSLSLTAHSFYIAYFAYTALIYAICKNLIQFSWSSEVTLLLIMALMKIVFLVIVIKFFGNWLSIFIGIILITISSILTFKKLSQVLDVESPILQNLKKIYFFRNLK